MKRKHAGETHTPQTHLYTFDCVLCGRRFRDTDATQAHQALEDHQLDEH